MPRKRRRWVRIRVNCRHDSFYATGGCRASKKGKNTHLAWGQAKNAEGSDQKAPRLQKLIHDNRSKDDQRSGNEQPEALLA